MTIEEWILLIQEEIIILVYSLLIVKVIWILTIVPHLQTQESGPSSQDYSTRLARLTSKDIYCAYWTEPY